MDQGATELKGHGVLQCGSVKSISERIGFLKLSAEGAFGHPKGVISQLFGAVGETWESCDTSERKSYLYNTGQ